MPPLTLVASSILPPSFQTPLMNSDILIESQKSSSKVEKIHRVMDGLAEIGMPGIKAEDLTKLLPPDIMEPALNIMADVCAYYQGSYRRHTSLPAL